MYRTKSAMKTLLITPPPTSTPQKKKKKKKKVSSTCLRVVAGLSLVQVKTNQQQAVGKALLCTNENTREVGLITEQTRKSSFYLKLDFHTQNENT